MGNREYEKKYGNEEYEKTDFQKEYDAYIQTHDPVPYKDSEKVVSLEDEEYAIKKRDEDIVKIEESNEDRHGFDLNMPVFERIVCKNTEDNETGNIINIFMYVFFICLIAIIDTGCRGAYLGFALFFPALFIGIIYYIQKKLGGLSNIKKRYKNTALAGTIGIILFSILNPAISKRFASIFALRADSSISFRLNVYESAINMFKDNPFLGIGVGNQNFREIYGLYMMSGFDALSCYSVFLEIAVENGIFALLAFLMFLGSLLSEGVRKYISSNDRAEKIILFTAFISIIAVMVHGLVDTIYFRPQIQFVFWTMVAIIRAILSLYKDTPNLC